MDIGAALSIGLIGIRAFVIQIQTFISPGLPYFSIIGLPDTSLSEARERVKSACHACGFRWPATRVTVNMSPASMPKRGASHDLAIAASVLSAAGAIPHNALEGTVVIGEVNLDGTVLPVNGLLPIMLHARSRGIKRAVVPYANLEEASLIDGIAIAGVRHLGELIELAEAPPIIVYLTICQRTNDRTRMSWIILFPEIWMRSSVSTQRKRLWKSRLPEDITCLWSVLRAQGKPCWLHDSPAL